MNLTEELRGIVTVLNTPYLENDAIDEAGLRRHVDYALGAGVVGILAPAMAGEVAKLTDAERFRLVDIVVEQARGRGVVIGGASALTPGQIIENARRLIDAGCDGVLAQIPFTSEAEYRETVSSLCSLSPGFLILQDWDASGSGLPVPFIAALAEAFPLFRGIKIEVMPAGPKYTQVAEATGGALHISGGWGAMQLLEGLDRGLHAFMPTAMHYTYASIYRAHAEGDSVRAEALFAELLPILAFTNQHLDVSIHFFKRLLHRQGVYATPRVRAPILPFDGVHERVADELIARAMGLERALGCPF